MTGNSRDPAPRVDRRVARTRALLQQAHLSLIVEKGYDAVTVEDICREANIGRSTFYTHFGGKEDLKLSGLASLRLELVANEAASPAEEARGVRLGFSRPMFEHARAHLDHYRALAGTRGEAVAIGAIRKVLSDLLAAELKAAGGRLAEDPAERAFAIEFIVGAFMAVMRAWLDAGAHASPGEMDRRFRKLALGGLEA